MSMNDHDPLKVPVLIQAQHQPLIDALRALNVDVGSVSWDKVKRWASTEMIEQLGDGSADDPDYRMLVVAAPDQQALARLFVSLDAGLQARGYHLSPGRVLMIGGPLDTALAVFLDIPMLRIDGTAA
jgi:hypothetical protein